MKILYIVQEELGDVASGKGQRSLRLWRHLCTLGDVTVLHWRDLHDRSIFAAVFRRLFRPAEWPWRLSCRNSPLSGTKFDLVVTRYLNTAVRAQAWKYAPCKVDIDDLPVESCRSVWSRIWPWGLRWVPRLIVFLWQCYAMKHLCGVWVANPADLQVVSRYCPCEVFPNAALPPKPGYISHGKECKILLTAAALHYKPNAEGAIWFSRFVWPLIHSRFPDWTWVLAGAGKTKVKGDGIEIAGFVPDLDSLYEKAAAVVVPVLSGAGTSIKVLEAIARDRMVFATKCALRGLDIAALENQVVCCEDAKAMADSICRWMGTFRIH